ncbi:rhamnan synthesis F family protein [Tropicimonas sp. IMCC6043]|uniref:rhamnan synthesis F family protein n=1 Tax=Tropicimonas sp. IMCC6043 TaxID=2510645 RepID=UPI0013EC584D|nr:rhamnan synthesis F family protein [Tropicimonas sp. IMCC6043]
MFLDTEVTFPNFVPKSTGLDHGPFAMWLVRKMTPRRIVGLGAGSGYSYFAMCQAVQEARLSTECLAVDSWTGEERGGVPDDSVFEAIAAENRQYAGFSRLLRMTCGEALDEVEDGSVDLLEIGRLRFGEELKQVFESWCPKLTSSAVVLLHDTEFRDRDIGVHRDWPEIRERHPSLEFRHGRGLGVVFWGGESTEGLRDLVDVASDPRDSEMIAAVFAALDGRMRSERALAGQDQRLADLEAEVADLRDLQVRLRARVNESGTWRDAIDAQVEEMNGLRRELAAERNAPWASVRHKLASRILFYLAGRNGLFSERRRGKFLKSALKRDPNRSIRDLEPEGAVTLAGAGPDDRRRQEAPSQRQNEWTFPTTVMVVSHEASRTGAPILALNLVRELSTRHNVVSVSLGGGELIPDFVDASAMFLELDRRKMPPDLITQKIMEACRRHDISVAFVNGVGSHHVLAGLKSAGVRSVALLHEFAAYIRPKSVFRDIFSEADQVVFSTRITLENALARTGSERPVNLHVLPQGKCATGLEDREADAEERLWLDSVLRPGGNEDRDFLVLGAGKIEPRKGLDLFIETANRVVSGPDGGRFRFVWIGQGYDPENDVRHSVYLADQIERAGVQSQVQIIRATSEIDHAYALADLLLLSSRLDPLPNVAIDMLLAGKPVVCFDRTTGIADFLEEAGLGEACVARYIDTAEMADKIRALAKDPAHLAAVAEAGTARARETFDFAAYTRQLEEIAETGGPKADLLAADFERLRSSGVFRLDFYTPLRSKVTDPDEIMRTYLRSNRSGPRLRKPAPGFNQLIYAEEKGWGKPEDPFVEYLEAGRPQGRWQAQVIDETAPIDDTALATARVALHLHAYFIDEFRDILARLEANRTRPSLFVSAPARQMEEVRAALESYSGPVAALRDVPNRGRDIAPFLTEFGKEMVAGFDIIGHLHTKQSRDLKDRAFVETWVEFLMENTLGGPKGGAMLDRIVSAMVSAPDLGIVYPDDPNLLGWSQNRAHAEQIAARMGIHDLPEHINYPMGTMFWARAGVIERFLSLELSWDDYPAEPLPYDGSLLHALERLLGVVPGHDGLRTGVTNIRGLTR